ncbi:MAG: phosphopentomutase [Actinomycetota bacterium]
MSRASGPRVRTVALIILDSVGIGGAPDAADFGDEGSATLQHVAAAVGGLSLPNLGRLGLGNLGEIPGTAATTSPQGAHGVMVERSPGKDTTTGHWELAGVILERAFPTYPDGFPSALLAGFEERIGVETLGNEAASGTEIIERLGSAHLESGRPIVYTSADSVFQLAAHIEIIPLDRLFEMCRVARDLLRGEHEVGRVIARPFRGVPGAFERTPDRLDFSVEPPSRTVLDALSHAGLDVRTVGKVSDIFAGRGVTHSHPTESNDDGIDAVIEELGDTETGLVFANLVDFDQSYGHRNDPEGYARALEHFDRRFPEILAAAGSHGVVVVTADHGNDPTTPSTDHSREMVPLLVAGSTISPADLGRRETFADCGATVAELLGVRFRGPGHSFARQLVA